MYDSNLDVRWRQRFADFCKAFAMLERFVAHKNLNEMEEQGLIKAFEYTYELSLKTLQDILKREGCSDVVRPRAIIEQGFLYDFIPDGRGWMKMYKNRGLASQAYDENTAREIVTNIRDVYFEFFRNLKSCLDEECQRQHPSIDE